MAITLTSSYKQIKSIDSSTYSDFRVYAKLDSQNTTANTSSITIQTRIYGDGGKGSWASGSVTTSVPSSDDSPITTSTGSKSYTKGNETTLATQTFTIKHASDGSYSNKTISSTLTTSANPSGTASGQITVTTIPRQNTITVPDQADIGSNINIVIGNNSSSFRNTVTWSCNGLGGTVVAANGTTLDKAPSGTYAWQVPTSIFATIPSGKSATVSFVNKTYSGTTKIGDDTTDSLTANVPTSSNPTLTLVSKVETTQAVKDAIPSSATDFTKPIINLSKPSFTFTATAKDSATLSTLTVTNGSNTRTTTLSGTTQSVTYTFQNPMTNPIITFDVTDSRGLTMTTPYVFDGTSQQFVYTVPIFKTVELERPDIRQNVVNAEVEGTYTVKKLDGVTNNKIWVGFDSMEVGGQYSGTIEWFESGVSQYITLDTTNGTWSFNGNLSSKTAEYNESYYFKVYVKDAVTGTQQDFTYMLKKSVPTMSLGESDMQVNGEIYTATESGDVKRGMRSLVLPKDTTDLDEIFETGMVSYNTNTSNAPSGYGVVYTLGREQEANKFWVYQTAYSTDGKIYTRRNINDLNLNSWTQWAEIQTEKNVITLGISANQSMTGTNAVIINIDTIREQVGNKLTLNTTNHRVTIGSGIKHVLVSCSGIVNAFTTNGLRRIFVRKNGTNVARAMSYYTQQFNNSIIIPPRLISVSQGDYIDFTMVNAGATTLYGTDVDTWFTIEVVD